MKKLLVFFVLLSKIIVSQNYHPVDPSRDAWFEYGTAYGRRMHSVKIDSVKQLANDTSYYNYKLFGILTATGNCIDQKDTNFFMDHMLVKQNGDHFFFTKNNDSILIKPFAPQNSTWILFHYQNGDHIDATVSSIMQQSLLGGLDSIKVITLQAKNVTNNPISNIFNNKEIRIGKNNGMVRFYNTLDFPSDTSSFNLIGRSNPQLGVTNLSAAKVYDWNIGDKFQYTGGYNAAPASASAIKEQFIVIGKNISANNDTITYRSDHLLCQTNYQFNPYDSTTFFNHDTVVQKVIISEKAVLDHYPYESINNVNATYGYLYQFNDNQYFGRMKKTLDAGYSYSSMDSCVGLTVGWCVFPVCTYAAGIGLVKQDNGGSTCFKKNIVYYEKGSEIWGSAIIMCSGTGINSYPQKENIIRVYPNPSNGNFIVEADPNKNQSIKVFDLSGKILLDQMMNGTTEIKADNLDAGIYTISVSGSGGPVNRKLIIIKR